MNEQDYISISHWGMFPKTGLRLWGSLPYREGGGGGPNPDKPVEHVVPAILRNGRIMLHPEMKECRLSNGVGCQSDLVELSPKEFKLLEYFLRNQNKCLSVRDIMKDVWGPAYVDGYEQYLRVALPKLLKKVGPCVENIRGQGYIMRGI